MPLLATISVKSLSTRCITDWQSISTLKPAIIRLRLTAKRCAPSILLFSLIRKAKNLAIAAAATSTNQQVAITKIDALATRYAVQWSVKILTPRLIAITRNNQLVIIRNWAAILERLNGIIKNRYLVFWISNIAKAIGCFVALGT